jgi:hypothetical protein
LQQGDTENLLAALNCEAITPDELIRHGSAMAARYRLADDASELVSAQITAYRTEADRDYVRRSEVILIGRLERVTLAELFSRLNLEARSRGIRRVALIQES